MDSWLLRAPQANFWADQATLVPDVVPGVVRPLNAVESDLEAEVGVEKITAHSYIKSKDSWTNANRNKSS